MNAEQFAQRLLTSRLLEQAQIDDAFSALGGQGAALEDFVRLLLEREWLTNWQVQRIEEGQRRGFFYGQWKVLYLVGLGTFARVYRGVHRKTGEIRAIKVLRSRYSNDLETRERFMREARMVMKLRHPNIVPIHEVAEEHHRTYMVMEFVEGQNLRDFVRVHQRLGLRTALNILRDVTAGLDYAARNGVTHRDLKLSNVLLSSTGRASLVDFGLAVADKSMADAPGFSPRSVDYAGLEKTTNVGRDDKRSDLFFLGCMLYHMLAGEAPLFETRERMRRMSAERFKKIPPVTNFVELPARIVYFLRRLMELDPAKRIQTPADALREIDDLIESLRSGHLEKYSEDLADRDSLEYDRRTRTIHEGHDRTIMVIESRRDVQDDLRNRLKRLGYRVLILGDPQRALARFADLDRAESNPADCLIFSCIELGRESLEAFNFFAQHPRTREIPAMLLVADHQGELAEHAALDERRTVVQMPSKFSEIRDRLREMLSITSDAGDEDD